MTGAPAPILRFAAVFAPALAAGWLADRLGVPLGFVIGAGVLTGVCAASRVDVWSSVWISRLAQLAIGVAIGLQVTPDVAGRMASWLWLMVLAALAGLALAAAAAPLYARLARVDRATAYFAMLPGGVAEMATVGERYGAAPTIVAAAQASRVALVVLILPGALIAIFGAGAGGAAFADRPALAAGPLAAAAVIGLIGAAAAARVGFSNAWILGPLIASAAASSLGLLDGRAPDAPLALAQAALGYALGARFRRETLGRAPRAAAAAALMLIVLAGASALLALAASVVVGLPPATLTLGFATGGMAEMVLTAKILAVDPTLVTAFQAVRAALVNGLAEVLWRRISRRS